MPVMKLGKQRFQVSCGQCRWHSRITTDVYGAAIELQEHQDLIHRAPLWRLSGDAESPRTGR